MLHRKPLGDLLAETPQMIVDLAKAEIEHLKREVAGKAKGLGVGAALLGVAGVIAIFFLAWLIYAAFEGLNVVFAPWLSALIVAFVLLLLAAGFALAGISSIKKNKDFDDLEAVDSIKDDVNMVRGLGHAADGTSPLDDLPTPVRTTGATGATATGATAATGATVASGASVGGATGASAASRATRTNGDMR